MILKGWYILVNMIWLSCICKLNYWIAIAIVVIKMPKDNGDSCVISKRFRSFYAFAADLL